MKKKLLYITMIATILLFGACSNEELLTESTGRTISLSVSMTDGQNNTRVDLNNDTINRTVELKWKVDDPIQLVFDQEGITKTSVLATVKRISEGGKTAHFNIEIPPSVAEGGRFTLYGVYGGGGINVAGENPRAILPSITDLSDDGTLKEIQDNKHLMLYFSKIMQATDTKVLVSFKHIGSLFTIKVKNNKTTAINVSQAELGGVSSSGVIGVASGFFDLKTGEFSNTELLNKISFKASATSIPAGGIIEFWAWYPPSDKEWGAISLKLVTGADPNNYIRTVITKQGKVAVAGKTYVFYGVVDSNNNLEFTDESLLKLPTLNTTIITKIDQTTAVSGGNISDDGGAPITARGICWSKSEQPTINNSKTIDGTGKGGFISNIGDLTPNTTYYVRAYATNSVGTSYGNAVTFKTLDVVAENYLKIGDNKFDLAAGILRNYGTNSAYNFGYNNDILLYSKGLKLEVNEFDIFTFSGKGHRIIIDMFSTNGNSLNTGDYVYSSTVPHPIGTFQDGFYLINFDNETNEAEDDGTIAEGKVSVSKIGNEYTITIDCINEENEKVTGFYKGTLRYFDRTD